jgi:acetolactate synthase-1/3 small subunit
MVQSIISTLVENKPGVLHKVSNMFRARNFNIQSISVGPTQNPDISRMTITVDLPPATVQQLIKQLEKLIDVIEVQRLDPEKTVFRELALVKLKTRGTQDRTDIMSYANIFRANIVDVSPESVTVEITGDPEKIDAFLNITHSFGIIEIARTGITALPRGVNKR